MGNGYVARCTCTVHVCIRTHRNNVIYISDVKYKGLLIIVKINIHYRIEVKLRRGKILGSGQLLDNGSKKSVLPRRPKRKSLADLTQEKVRSETIYNAAETDSTSEARTATDAMTIHLSSASSSSATTTYTHPTLEQGQHGVSNTSSNSTKGFIPDPTPVAIPYMNLGYLFPTVGFNNSNSNNFGNYDKAWK